MHFDGAKDPARRQALDAGGERVVNEGWREYRKTATTWMRRIDVGFTVDTPEGRMKGKAGDFLACGVGGEMYPVDAAIAAASHEPV